MAILDFLKRNNDLAPVMKQALSKYSKREIKKMMVELHEKTELLSRKDIASWRIAWQRAIDVQNPNRCALYDIYTDIEIDLHITGDRKSVV